MIGIIIALQSEASALLDKVDELNQIKLADKTAYTCKINGRDTVIAISGIGKVNAALTTQLVIDKFKVDFILNFGTCGGLNDSVEIKNYYVVDKCCQYDFDLSDLDDVPVGYIQEYKTVYFETYTKGLDFLQKSMVASADKFTHKEQDVELVNKMGCSLCDMEAGAIAQVCTSNNVPLIVIKGISDLHGNGTAPEQFFKNLSTVGENFPSVILKVLEKI